jgi:hypothetical protein
MAPKPKRRDELSDGKLGSKRDVLDTFLTSCGLTAELVGEGFYAY